MGPSQGRFSSLAMARLMAQETELSLADVGQTTARPPWVPVPMGVLAGRPVQPAKRSAIHGRHRDLGARVLWAGDWRRAYDYGDPQGEALNVHRNAGLIDVSTLGKLLVQGPDAGRFLDRMYPNRISDLAVGRTRYGVMVSEAGRITDDGTICRLDESAFYVTTTSSGAGAVEELFGSWLADWGMDVHMTDVTQALGAMNIAGPRAREIMGTLTDLDLATESFRYMDAKRAHVAGVPCLIMRIGFVGEVGFELHFPAALGEDLWNAISDAGAPAGLRPFGLEPQRILRLQKQHILVGQDTDSETSPYEAAMPWIVKLDKDEDFIGRWALEHRSQREPETQLVGFTTTGTDVPTEGAAVLGEDGQAVGRVTSSRWSPQLERVIGLAVVPAGLATDGGSITLSDQRRRSLAQVVTRPFYDPDGEVLRS
jgi:sarcosine oxidase subunit alpha